MQGPFKKRKLAHGSAGSVKAGSKAKGKDHAYDRLTIAVPRHDDDDENSMLDEEDAGMLEEFGGAVKFLSALDEKGIARCAAVQYQTSSIIFIII